jgi:hypothetical protein
VNIAAGMPLAQGFAASQRKTWHAKRIHLFPQRTDGLEPREKERHGSTVESPNQATMHPRYSEWITHVFDHPVTRLEWYHEWDGPDFEASDEEIADLICETFTRSGEDLRRFSDEQVACGVRFLIDPCASDYPFCLRDGDLPLSKKVAGIRSIFSLFRDCFSPRCAETLGHLDEPGGTELNAICYMFWDICPLAYLEGKKDKETLENSLFWVLESTLALKHRACVESALHGLGHYACYSRSRVERVIDAFLKHARPDDKLRRYAENARDGCVL